jgi:hypothetical protein
LRSENSVVVDALAACSPYSSCYLAWFVSILPHSRCDNKSARAWKRNYRLAFSDEEGTYRALTLPGFWLRVEWLWQEPLPKTLDVLRELGLL